MFKPKLILLDLDGTLYVGNEPLPGAVEALLQLRERGFPVRFLTNTTTKSQQQLLAQLRGLGFTVAEEELISAPVAARLELRALQEQIKPRSLRIWPVVHDALKPDFSEFIWDDTNPDVIVLGDISERWDLPLINRLFNLMHSGAELVALHSNRFWQTADGLHVDIGFFVAGLEYVCNKKSRIMGKPNADFFQRVLAAAGVSANETLMIGDDIDSDVGGAQLLGMQAYLVKTGKFRDHYLAQSTVKPDAILHSIADLPGYLSP